MQEILTFRPKHLLGEGGFAEVWYAESAIGKRAAIKLLKSHLSQDPGLRERFEQEARFMAQLDHPGIRQVYGYDSNVLAIVMEYLEGEDLASRARRLGAASAQEVRKWLKEALEALAYAHAQGVVHRDIKPSNLFLTNRGNISILDFGIARMAAEGDSHTRTGAFLGSPMYMSPEQIDDPRSVDHRTDVYSLAVTAWTLLANRKPFDDSSGSERKLLNQIADKPLPQLRIQDQALEAWIRACTAKDKAKRPSAREALKMLSQHAALPPSSPAADPDNTLLKPAKATATPGRIHSPHSSKTGHPAGQVKKVLLGAVAIAILSFAGWAVYRATTFPSCPGELVGEMVDIEYGEIRRPWGWEGVQPFEIAKTEVTVGQFAKFVDATGYQTDAENGKGSRIWTGKMAEEKLDVDWRMDEKGKLRSSSSCDHPVIHVSLNDAMAYCKWLSDTTGQSYRLPTEEEWLLAATGGSYSRFSWGSEPPKGKQAGNVADETLLRIVDTSQLKGWFTQFNDGYAFAAPVGQFDSTGSGLYDMTGNVAEWCSTTQGSGVIKGGSWLDGPENCEISYRNTSIRRDGQGIDLGFRIVRVKK